ncbi:MAG: hypothetical protein AABY32_05080 [Nanoarchaeota archaeon]
MDSLIKDTFNIIFEPAFRPDIGWFERLRIWFGIPFMLLAAIAAIPSIILVEIACRIAGK